MRLSRTDPNAPGIRRVRCGRGFRYLTADDQPADDLTVQRIRALVIPPAWQDVWICPRPNGHIQAVGTDDAGRRQYLYHDEWRRLRDEEKFDRALELSRLLPAFRERLRADLHTSGLHRERVLAAGLRALDLGVFRTGGEEYAEENGSRGVATLLREHVRIRRGELEFRYPAKGGIDRAVVIRDEALCRAVAALKRTRHAGSDRLLVYRDPVGWHEARAEDLNERLQELTGEEFTAKDLRTWNATVLAAAAFGAADRPDDTRDRKRVEAAVMREVADELGNTPAVARESYVDPYVITAYHEGTTIRSALRADLAGLADDTARDRLERAVARLLRGMRENG